MDEVKIQRFHRDYDDPVVLVQPVAGGEGVLLQQLRYFGTDKLQVGFAREVSITERTVPAQVFPV